MIGVIAKLKIKDGDRDNFIEAMGKLVQAVADNEPDCFYYEMHETDDPQTIMMIELYKTEEAIKVIHKQNISKRLEWH